MDHSLIISEAHKSDLEELSALYQQLIPHEVALDQMNESFDRNLGNPHHIVLVAKINYRVVGSLLACICEMFFGQCKSFMVIEDFVVDKNNRGSGIGSALLKEAETIACKQDVSYIMLITDRNRVESRNFYAARGYSSDEYCAFKKKLTP